MTTVLYLNRSKKLVSLHIITNRLLNAIDNNEIEKVEKYIETILQYHASWDLLLMLSRYAKEVKQPMSYRYLEQIIETTYNFSLSSLNYNHPIYNPT